MPRQKARRLVIAASGQSFDQKIIGDWEAEGFEVRFEPVRDGTKASMRSIESIADSLEEGEKYAIVSVLVYFLTLASFVTLAVCSEML